MLCPVEGRAAGVGDFCPLRRKLVKGVSPEFFIVPMEVTPGPDFACWIMYAGRCSLSCLHHRGVRFASDVSVHRLLSRASVSGDNL